MHNSNLEIIKVLGWVSVAKKGQFQIGELVAFFEPDSVFPKLPEFEFLSKTNYVVRPIKIRGVISLGIAYKLPELLLAFLDLNEQFSQAVHWEEGFDLT